MSRSGTRKGALVARLLVLIPVIMSIIGMVLSALALFAGREKGFMEDYAVARLNVSMVGQRLISKDSDNKDDKDDDDDDDDGIFDSLKDKFDDVKDSVVDEVDDLVGDAVDGVANAIGISDWYSIHIMDTCEGNFKPNATAPSPSLNITNCTSPEIKHRLNLTKMLDKEMSLGPVDINLSDIGWPDEIQGVLNRVNDALYTLFILYAMGMGFSGLGLLGCAAGAWWHDSKLVTKGNLVVASLAAGSLLIGSGVITGAVMKGVGKITDLGEHVGVSVSRGNKFLALTWVATVFMALVVVFWGVLFGVQKRNDKKGDRRMSDMSNMSNKIC